MRDDYWTLAHGEKTMTDRPEDHNEGSEQALRLVHQVESRGGPSMDTHIIALAQVQATLALVREQQVANRLTAQMISLTRAMSEEK